MERIEQLHMVEYVEYMPQAEDMKQGVLYVSKRFGTAIHLCACGCGRQSVTPFGSSTGWQLTASGTKVTLAPSILNTDCPNRAHYFIRNNKVIWA